MLALRDEPEEQQFHTRKGLATTLSIESFRTGPLQVPAKRAHH